jgi:hydroxypyruvate reductase/glycerate 2-kinase
MIIKNKAELSISESRKQVLDIIEAGIARILPSAIMQSAVRYDSARKILTVNNHPYPLAQGRIFVVGGGKAAGLMAKTLEDIIGAGNISAGVVTCNCRNSSYKTSKIKIVQAGHPLPDQRGVNGVKQMLTLRGRYSINANDLIICLISGGGSALMPCPIDGVDLKDKQRITELLLHCGAEINEINAVRKHLSKIKGGRLGDSYSPATVVSLILSDVIGNDLNVIASGPTCPDSSTFLDAYSVLERYKLLSSIPKSVLNLLTMGCHGEVKETPKTLHNCHSYIIGDNTLALEAMTKKAKEKGFTPYIATAGQKGDTTTVARLRATEMLNGSYTGYDIVLIGGETTPKLPDTPGKGGRNQHYAAVSMLAMKDYPGEWVAASIGTDGSDFLPSAAGAIVDNNSLGIARTKGIDVKSHLDRYDSNTLLKKIGGSLIVTGNTGTNVGDLIVYALK